jgi:hypothetical protein
MTLNWKSFSSGSGFGLGSGSRDYFFTVFQQQKNGKNLAFSVSEAALFPKNLAS